MVRDVAASRARGGGHVDHLSVRRRGDGEEAHVAFQQFRRPMARIEATVEESVAV